MVKDITQEDCRKEWEALKRSFLSEIQKIDKNTPAVPHTEPSWWVEMSNVERYILDLVV